MDIAPLLPPIGGLCALLGLSAFFSGSETALCALSRAQIERLRLDGTPGSSAIVRFLDDPRLLFITTLLGNTFVNIAFATTTAVLIYRVLGSGPSGATTTAIIVFITIALLLFGEITPKTVAIRHPERFAQVVARPLWLFSGLIAPLRAILRLATDVLIPLFAGSEPAESVPITSDDLRALLEAEAESTLAADEREILSRILEFREIEAQEVMVPRDGMVSTTTEATIQATLDLARRVGLSRIPVFRDASEEVCGFFHVKDWLLWRNAGIREQRIAEFLATRDASPLVDARDTLVRRPHFAAQSTNLAELLSELTHQKTKIVMLTDADGSISGVLSVEDIVEEVVGEILDEHDVSGPVPGLVRATDDPRVIQVAGRVGVRRLNREVGLNLDPNLGRSVGAYASRLLGRTPSVGACCSDANGLHFEVRSATGERIDMLSVTLPNAARVDE